ncbi:hypothetical protein Bca101_054410 [Brassica carinata]
MDRRSTFFDWQGEKVDPLVVERLSEREKIGFRCAYLQKISRIGKDKKQGMRNTGETEPEFESVGCVC